MDGRILDEIYQLIESRRGANPGESWTAALLQGAPSLPARKLGEEATECIIEAMRGDRQALTHEAADVMYHLLVVLAAADIRPKDVWGELDARRHQSGHAEKATRTQNKEEKDHG